MNTEQRKINTDLHSGLWGHPMLVVAAMWGEPRQEVLEPLREAQRRPEDTVVAVVPPSLPLLGRSYI